MAERTEVEVAREFIDPAPGDWPAPWDAEFHGEPDLTKPPPGSSGHAMRWVTRTVTYANGAQWTKRERMTSYERRFIVWL